MLHVRIFSFKFELGLIFKKTDKQWRLDKTTAQAPYAVSSAF